MTLGTIILQATNHSFCLVASPCCVFRAYADKPSSLHIDRFVSLILLLGQDRVQISSVSQYCIYIYKGDIIKKGSSFNLFKCV